MRVSGVLLLVAWPVDPASAQVSQTKTARLEYARGEGAADCPDERQVRDGVAARLGYDPFEENAEAMVTVRIDRDGEGLVARVVLSGKGEAEGERVVRSRDRNCGELALAIVLAVSIAIDPLSFLPAAEPRSPSPPAPPPPPPAPSAAAPPPQPARPEARTAPIRPPSPATRTAPIPPPPRYSATVSAGGLFAHGSLLGPLGGLSVRGALRSAALSAGVEGRLDLPTSEAIEGGRVSAWSWLGTLVTCGHYGGLGFCGLLGVGRTRVSSEDLGGEGTISLPLSAAGPRTMLEVPLGGDWSVEANVDVLAMLWRPTVVVGADQTRQVAPFSVAVGLALGRRLW